MACCAAATRSRTYVSVKVCIRSVFILVKSPRVYEVYKTETIGGLGLFIVFSIWNLEGMVHVNELFLPENTV